MASEKAIQEALRVLFTDVVVKDGPTRMRAALDAAAAVDGDAGWNEAIEEAAKKMFSVPLDGVPLLAQHKVSARDMEIAASIRSLKRLK